MSGISAFTSLYTPTGTTTLAAGVVSTSVAYPSTGAALTSLIWNDGPSVVYVVQGNSTVVATPSGTPILPGNLIALAQGFNTTLAAITLTGAAALIIESGTGNPQIVFAEIGPDAVLTAPTINGGTINDAVLNGVTLEGISFDNPTVIGGTFTGPTINGGTITDATLEGGTLDGFSFVDPVITGATISASEFNGGQITGAGITAVETPVNPTDAANKAYVDASIVGLAVKQTATVATTIALPAYTYVNGTLGVGATLTATAAGALVVDGYTTRLADVVLVKNEVGGNAPVNGLYSVTTLGTVSVPFVLTRTSDMDTAAGMIAALVPVGPSGSTNMNSLWLSNPTAPVVVGTTAIPFVQLIIPAGGVTSLGGLIGNVGLGANLVASGGSIAVAGLGSAAFQSAGSVDFTGGTISGVDGSGMLALASGSSVPRSLGTRFGQVMNVIDWGAKGDLQTVTGLFSWNGNTLSVTGGTANFQSTDVGKELSVPAGQNHGGGISSRGLVTIASVVNSNTVTTGTTAALPFTGLQYKLNDAPGTNPTEITMNAAGSGYQIGNLLAVNGGTFAAAGTLEVLMTTVVSASVANTGSLGPPGPFNAIGITGQGQRVQVTGSISSAGTIAGGVTISAPGTYWLDVASTSAEPIMAFPNAIGTTATFANNSNTVVVASSTGMLVGNPISAFGIPQGDTIASIGGGGTLTIGPSNTTQAQTLEVACTVTNNSQPVYLSANATFNANTVVVSGTAGIAVGMAVGGDFILGSGNPTDPNVTTITTIAAGGTLTLHSPLGNAITETVSGGTLIVEPFLTGAEIDISLGIVSCCLAVPGAYSVLPSFPASTTAVSGSGTSATVTVSTAPLAADYFTDDSAALSAVAQAAQTLAATGISTVIEFVPGKIHGHTASLNFTNIRNDRCIITGNFAELRSFLNGGIAFDMAHSDGMFISDLVLSTGRNAGLQPAVGMNIAVTSATPSGNHVLENIWINGNYTAGCIYVFGSESTHIGPAEVFNGCARSAMSFGFIADGNNSFGISSIYIPQTIPPNTNVTFNGLTMPEFRSLHGGFGSSYYFAGLKRPWVGPNAYSATWARPGVWVSCGLSNFSGGIFSPYWDIHFETSTHQDSYFLTGATSLVPISGLTAIDTQNQAQNSIFGLDYTKTNFQVSGATLQFSVPVGTASLFDPIGASAVQVSANLWSLNGNLFNPTGVTEFFGNITIGLNSISSTVSNLTVATKLSVLGTTNLQGNVTMVQENVQGSSLLADLRLIGLSQPSTLNPPITPITNGGTISISAVAPSTFSGPIIVNVGTGTIAGCTIFLPVETQIPAGCIQDIECTGTVVDVTWRSLVGAPVSLLPTALSNVSPVHAKWHPETPTPQWMPA